MNRVVRAIELAQGAADALSHLDHRDRLGNPARALEHRGRPFHGDAIERTGVHAVDTTGALLQLDKRFGPLLRFELRADLPVSIENRVVRTHRTASSAVDAEI